MSKLDPLFSSELAQAESRRVRRRLRTATAAPAGRIALDGVPALNFSSNDYLGLSKHPLLIERAREWAARHGAGAQASRLVCGNLDLHEQVEAKLARLKGTEAALLLASGWQANAAVLPALLRAAAGKGEVQVYADKLNHASLHHGCQAAGVRQIRFRHNDLDHLEALLAPGGIDLAMGTFSKALGGFGAYVAGSRALCDYLVNACSGFIYTTALPPAVLGAMDAALDLVPTLDAERARLAASGERLRVALRGLGLDSGDSSTQIVPAIVGDEGRALALAATLEQRGLLAVAIRPPTVPAGTSRLRIALSAAHRDADIDRLIDGLTAALA